jgi:hypothetical protein
MIVFNHKIIVSSSIPIFIGSIENRQVYIVASRYASLLDVTVKGFFNF